jgi:DNA excision repair protein ERCC-1
MVDIPDHEECLRELSKTSLVNNVTIILTWSAAEAARYLELYKSYEHANFAAIKGQQATSYAEKLVEFVTVPRSINKADAVALVSTFGSLKAAVNADPEQVAVISGWGEKKVKSWCKAVEEPFRIKKATKRTAGSGEQHEQPQLLRTRTTVLDQAVPLGGVPSRDVPARSLPQDKGSRSGSKTSGPGRPRGNSRNVEDDEDAMLAAAIEESKKTAQQEAAAARRREGEEQLSDGIAAALARLREKG